MSFKIIDLDLKHLSKYVDFKNQSAKESTYLNSTTEEKAQGVIEEYKNDPDKKAFILLDGKEIVGQLFLKLDRKKNLCFILLISILEAYYGKGASKQLLDKVFKVAKEEHLPEIELCVHEDNTRAIKFYEKTGFKYLRQQSKHNKIYGLTLKNVSVESLFDMKQTNPLYLNW